MDEQAVLMTDLQGYLSDSLDEGLALNVTDRASNLRD